MFCLSRYLGFILVVFYPLAVLGSASVREIEFSQLDGNSREGDWLECTVEVEIRRDPRDLTRQSPDYIDDLEVDLMLGVEKRDDSRLKFDFYRSKASLVALKEGRHSVRFYLPPEIVERDQIKNEVHSFIVRLHRSGQVVYETLSRRLERPQIKESFLKRVEAESPRNDGILLPQYKTPFFMSYPRETPRFRDSDIPVLNP